MSAALATTRPGAFWLFEFAVGGTTYKHSIAAPGYASDASGQYDGTGIELGSLTQRLPDWRGGIASMTLDVVFSDVDRSFGRIIEGSGGRGVRDADATVYLAHPDVAKANWYTFFVGEIATWGWPEPGKARVTLRTKDRALRYDVPKSGWILSSADWLNAPQESISRLAPIIYGTHSSEQTTIEGAVPCIYVDETNYKWLVCAGWAKAVNNVYVDGEKQPAADYDILHPVVRGRQYTVIQFDADPGAGESVEVSADVEGLEDNADGTGDLIEDPPAVLAHFLSNFVFADWMKGAWNATNSIIDTTSFADTYFSDRGAIAAVYISERVRGYDRMDDLAVSFGVSLYWGNDGTLRWEVQKPQRADAYTSTALRWDRDNVTPMSSEQPEDRATSITCQYGYDSAREDYSHSLTVREPYIEDEQPDNMEMSWGAAQ